MKTYSKIAELKIEHTYYTSGLCPGLTLTPTKNTAALMTKYNFTTREINGTYQLIGEDQENLIDYFEYITRITEVDAFIFELKLVDPNFFIFTDISKKTLVTYNYSTSNRASGNILKPELQADTGVFGNVLFCFADMAKNKDAVYQIQYSASAPIWDYIVVNRSELDINDCIIRTSDGTEFSAPVEITIPTGEKAISYRSTKPIAMGQTSKVTYDLVKLSQNSNLPNGKIIFKSLPLAAPVNTNVSIQNGEDQYVSSIYIYI